MTPTKYTHPLETYAERYGVSLSTIKRWSARGLNLDDPHAISLHISDQKHEPASFDPDGKAHERAEEIAKVLADGLEEFDGVAKIITSGKCVEGLNCQQTIAGHRRLMAHMLTRFWKRTLWATQGGKLADFQDEEGEG